MSVGLRARLAQLLPTPPHGPLPLALPRRRIYIVPSRFGAVYGLALFVLMIGALNYNNNAAILLALLLGVSAMASAHTAVRFLAALSVIDFRAGEAFAGDQQDCLLLVRATAGPVRGELRMRQGDLNLDAQLDESGLARFAWRWSSERRGRRTLGRIRLSTQYPLGLFYAWCLLTPEVAAVVYPAPESPPMPLPMAHDHPGERVQPRAGDEDWHALREFQRGDSQRDIAWKASARHDRWLVAETRSASQAPTLRFSLDQVAALEREHGLSRLTRWIVLAEAAQRPYALNLPDHTIGPGLGAQQRQRALTALADLP